MSDEHRIYVVGDLSSIEANVSKNVVLVSDLSVNFEHILDSPKVQLQKSGRVPRLVHGVGAFIPQFFAENFFHHIVREHAFQSLTESNKPGTAHRTGIYLTPVTRSSVDNSSQFHLLRCSSNLSGPTGNFGTTDTLIVDALNEAAQNLFSAHAPLNHVLAQIYHNTPATDEQKQTKAVIKAHADKTKDMPVDGIMAFCTFYDRLDHLHKIDNFDFGLNGVSALTKLYFRLKDPAFAEHGFVRQFTVTLSPNSVFFMPLTTNRIYTHEIRPSALDAKVIPTRMGYVVRCSKSIAMHLPGKGTFLKTAAGLEKMEAPTTEQMQSLRALYAQENATTNLIDYGTLLFSMNRGDYLEPLYRPPFLCVSLPQIEANGTSQSMFQRLQAGITFGDVTKGRQGQVLVRCEARGTPIVRTTTKYASPAYQFQQCHAELADQIAQTIESSTNHEVTVPAFNNALIEIYDKGYTSMGFHSDQSLDLSDDTSIALYSCYQYPELRSAMRKLVVESKADANDTFEIPLLNNSIVAFSATTNRLYRHKIVLDMRTVNQKSDNPWLGMTFRTSKTFVQFHQGPSGVATLEDGTALTLASDEQCTAFYKIRKLENEQQLEFAYPLPGTANAITFTISPSDLMPPQQ